MTLIEPASRPSRSLGGLRVSHRLCAFTVAISVAACAPPPEEAEEDVVEQSESNLTLLTIRADAIPPSLVELSESASDIIGQLAELSGYAETAFKLAKAFGIFPGGPSEFSLLIDEINRVGTALDWKMTALERNTQENQLSAAVGAARRTNVAAGERLALGGNEDFWSEVAAGSAGGLVMFQRLYSAKATDGEWKKIISASTPTRMEGDQVFDWRFGMPWFLRAIALRLQVIAAVDPQLSVSRNPELIDELRRLRASLEEKYNLMMAGIRCQSRMEGPFGLVASSARLRIKVACADVNTGVSVIETHDLPADNACISLPGKPPAWNYNCLRASTQAQVDASMEFVRGTLVKTLPTFVTRTVIDNLGRLINGGPDLTKFDGSIRSTASGMCVDVQWGNSAAGTPVWLWPCNGGDAQQWAYDRETHTIRNPVFDKCLDVAFSNPSRGSTVWIWDCNGSDAQKWTYDPVSNVLQNGMGTVLDVAFSSFTTGAQLWAWTRNESEAQWWAPCVGSCGVTRPRPPLR